MTFISQPAIPQQQPWTISVLKLVAWVCQILNEIGDRQRMKENLIGLSARHLRDIGSTENDVASIDFVSLPGSGATQLSRLRKLRSKNW